jgi:hypothetical protein
MESRLLGHVETALILLMVVGFVLIAQTFSFDFYRIGLVTVIGATILNIAVGNVPHSARNWRAVRFLVMNLAITAFVFWLGIQLVPYLSRLGQGS